MNYRKMGRTGLMVSEISLGTVNFGSVVKEAEAIAIVNKAYQAGINHFDTANVYPIGSGRYGISEEILGKPSSRSGRKCSSRRRWDRGSARKPIPISRGVIFLKRSSRV